MLFGYPVMFLRYLKIYRKADYERKMFHHHNIIFKQQFVAHKYLKL